MSDYDILDPSTNWVVREIIWLLFLNRLINKRDTAHYLFSFWDADTGGGFLYLYQEPGSLFPPVCSRYARYAKLSYGLPYRTEWDLFISLSAKKTKRVFV